MRARGALVGALAIAAVLGACSDADDTASDRSTTTVDPAATTPTFVGDGSPFCDAMLGVGQIERSDDATPEEVLAENEVLLGHLDDAQANAPADAPSDLEALIDDYRVAALALEEAGGDLEAAFAALQRDAPEVVERIGSSTSHPAAFEFLVARCGVTEE